MSSTVRALWYHDNARSLVAGPVTLCRLVVSAGAAPQYVPELKVYSGNPDDGGVAGGAPEMKMRLPDSRLSQLQKAESQHGFQLTDKQARAPPPCPPARSSPCRLSLAPAPALALAPALPCALRRRPDSLSLSLSLSRREWWPSLRRRTRSSARAGSSTWRRTAPPATAMAARAVRGARARAQEELEPPECSEGGAAEPVEEEEGWLGRRHPSVPGWRGGRRHRRGGGRRRSSNP
eukprot:COSAG01_NODE_8361_length_2817_cov_1.478661_2_plen_235_part_00